MLKVAPHDGVGAAPAPAPAADPKARRSSLRVRLDAARRSSSRPGRRESVDALPSTGSFRVEADVTASSGMSAGESLTQAVQTILARKHQTRIRRIDHAMFALVLVSLALMVTWQTVTVPEARLAVEAGNSGITLALLALLARYHRLQRAAERSRVARGRGGAERHFHGARWAATTAVEVLVLIVHPPPMTAAAGLPPGAALLMLLRLYVGLRVLRDNSAYYRSASAQHSLGRRAAAGPTAFTAIKSWFHTQPLTSAAVSTLGASLAAAYGIYVCENHRQQTVEDWFDDGAGLSLAPRGFGESLWLVIATMTTVGYGDTAPESWGGRILAMTAAVIGILLTAITISVVPRAAAAPHTSSRRPGGRAAPPPRCRARASPGTGRAACAACAGSAPSSSSSA